MSALIFLLFVLVIGLGIATFCFYMGYKNFKALVTGMIDENKKEPTKKG